MSKVANYGLIILTLDAYGLFLSQYWAARLDGYFASDWSHLWLPYKGSPNQIKVLREPQMKYNVTQLEEKNELVNSMMEITSLNWN